MKNIRNFCIIAHIDHGKSTLADRFLEVTGAISKREMKNTQMLDTMELEQERGITIKLQPARMTWQDHTLNLIDTPGHVDFQYEVSRSLAAVEGAILVVDATQGIEAQTISNVYIALEHELTIIPVLNKTDLPNSDVEKVKAEMTKMFGFSEEEMICVSAKTGDNVDQVLDAVIERIPPPTEPETGSHRALIFDSVYSEFQGVITYVRVMDGEFHRGDKIQLLGTDTPSQVMEIGVFRPQREKHEKLSAGEIGYIVTDLREIGKARVGDTIARQVAGGFPAPLSGYEPPNPMVFAGVFCIDSSDFPLLRTALEKLALNDASLIYEPESSAALGFGFRCGFLGLLHLDIIHQRLEREYDLDLIFTTPNVAYELETNTGEVKRVSAPTDVPLPNEIASLREPIMNIEIFTPKRYLGAILELLDEKRGVHKALDYADEDRMIIKYEVPLSEIVVDFFDRLKSISQGYASMSYDFLEYRAGKLVKLDILIAGDIVPPLAMIVPREQSHKVGQRVLLRLKEIIPKQQFTISLQAAISSKVVAREDISAMRKDVLAKLYGGDQTRKDKLLKKQKAGKKKMKSLGKVSLPKEAFMAVLKKQD